MITILKRTRNDLPFAQKKFLKKTKRGKVIKGAFHIPSMSVTDRVLI